MKKSIVLLSGGLDSLVSCKRALEKTEVVLALTLDYGQKARLKEIASAKKAAELFNLPHIIIKLPWFKDIIAGALVNPELAPPQIKDFSQNTTRNSAQRVWVYNRNGLFINIAAVYAEKFKAHYIVTGFNKEEAQTFPDNSQDFCLAISDSLKYSTQNHPRVISFTQDLTKPQIVGLALKIKAPLEFVWSCYLGEKKMCGLCESCQRFKNALAANNILYNMEKSFQNANLIS